MGSVYMVTTRRYETPERIAGLYLAYDEDDVGEVVRELNLTDYQVRVERVGYLQTSEGVGEQLGRI